MDIVCNSNLFKSTEVSEKEGRAIIAEYKRETTKTKVEREVRFVDEMESRVMEKVLTARVCSSQEVFQSKDVESSRESCSSKQRAYRFRKESSQKLLWWR